MRTISVPKPVWSKLSEMRRKKPGKKEYESFNDVITRLLGKQKVVPDAEG